ncbi:unnamed protein product, partial [Candidula unifasciata]
VAALMAALIFGAVVYLTELISGEHTFRNVALATWYSYETMTAIGSGRVVPSSVPGNVIAVCCSMFGVILFSMPIAIVKESFKQYLVALRTYKHQLVRVNYLRNQGQENAFLASRMFWYRPDGVSSTSPMRPTSPVRSASPTDESDLSMV